MRIGNRCLQNNIFESLHKTCHVLDSKIAEYLDMTDSQSTDLGFLNLTISTFRISNIWMLDEVCFHLEVMEI